MYDDFNTKSYQESSGPEICKPQPQTPRHFWVTSAGSYYHDY